MRGELPCGSYEMYPHIARWRGRRSVARRRASRRTAATAGGTRPGRAPVPLRSANKPGDVMGSMMKPRASWNGSAPVASSSARRRDTSATTKPAAPAPPAWPAAASVSGWPGDDSAPCKSSQAAAPPAGAGAGPGGIDIPSGVPLTLIQLPRRAAPVSGGRTIPGRRRRTPRLAVPSAPRTTVRLSPQRRVHLDHFRSLPAVLDSADAGPRPGATGVGKSLPVPGANASVVAAAAAAEASVDEASRNRFSRRPRNGARTVPAIASVSAAASKATAFGVTSAHRVPSATVVRPSAAKPLFWQALLHGGGCQGGHRVYHPGSWTNCATRPSAAVRRTVICVKATRTKA